MASSTGKRYWNEPSTSPGVSMNVMSGKHRSFEVDTSVSSPLYMAGANCSSSSRRWVKSCTVACPLSVSRFLPDVQNVKPCVSIATAVRCTCSPMYQLM